MFHTLSEPIKNSKTTIQEKIYMESTKFQSIQKPNMSPNSIFQTEKEINLRNEYVRFASSSLPKPQMSQVSTDTLRLLGIFDTKPIVSCAESEKEAVCTQKLINNNFNIKCSALLDYVHSKKSTSAYYRQRKLSTNIKVSSPNSVETEDVNEEYNIEEAADSRMIKMYFSHLEDKSTDSSSSSSSSSNSSRVSSPSPSKSSSSDAEPSNDVDNADSHEGESNVERTHLEPSNIEPLNTESTNVEVSSVEDLNDEPSNGDAQKDEVSNDETSNSESSNGDASNGDASTYSQSTSSRNEESIISVSSIGSGNSGNTYNRSRISIAPGILPPGRPIGHYHQHSKQSILNNLKKKRCQRQFHDYFHAYKHGLKMYHLIRHSFSGPKEYRYLRLRKTKQRLRNIFWASRNTIRRITPETEQVETGKVLLISQHAIKLAKPLNTHRDVPENKAITTNKKRSKTFHKYLHRTGIYSLCKCAPRLENLFVTTEDGPYERVVCGEMQLENDIESLSLATSKLQQHLPTISQFDHMYISDVTTATMDHFIASIKVTHPTDNDNNVASQNSKSVANAPETQTTKKQQQEQIETEVITNTKFIDNAITVASPYQQIRRKNLDFLMIGANAFTAEQVARTKVIEKGEEKLSTAKRIVKLLKENPNDWCMPVMKMCRQAVAKGKYDPPPAKPKLSMSRRLLDKGMADLSQRIRMMNVVAEYGEDLLQFDFASKPDDERLSHLIQFCMKISKTKEISFQFAVYMVAESYLMTFTHGQLLEGVEKYKKLLDAYDMRRSVCI